MGNDLGPWTRLIEDHRRNVARLEATEPAPPLWWGLPLGFLAPWLCFAVAVAWRDPAVTATAVSSYALLVPIGLACLFVARLQTVATGLVLGIGSSLFATAALFG